MARLCLYKVHVLTCLEFIGCLTLVSTAVIATENVATSERSPELNSTLKPERLVIDFKDTLFNQIEPDVLQAVDTNRVYLQCSSSLRPNHQVEWIYHGIQESLVDLRVHANNYIGLQNFSAGPPVVRLECRLESLNGTISNFTYIYRGENKAPYLHNNSKSVAVNFINETTANLQCLLNYPLDEDKMELQLFKDGVQVDNKNGCMQYIPEYGFIVNLTELEQPLGKYTCRVVNSTEDDFVEINIDEADIVNAKIEVKYFASDRNKFFTKDPALKQFVCRIPKAKFENKFEWYFKRDNGSYTRFLNEKPTDFDPPTNQDDKYADSVLLKFPDANITGVVCAAYLSENGSSYNNSYAVHVTEPEPVIIHTNGEKQVIYKEGMNLTCSSSGDPSPTYQWFKDGKLMKDAKYSTTITKHRSSFSDLDLDPKFLEKSSNYTCVASNFLGSQSRTWTVKLSDQPTSVGKIVAIVIGVCVMFLAVATLVFLLFFKVTPRQFSDAKIQAFLHGIGFKTQQYNQFGEQEEPYERVSYDASKEIDVNALKIVRELKRGNFGKVDLGYYYTEKESYGRPVAIKTIKDDYESGKDELEGAFEDFLKEIKIMQIIGEHDNIVNYIGAVTSDLSKFSAYLVIEYCCEGDLASYVRGIHKNGGSFQDDVQGLQQNISAGCSRGSMTGVTLKTSHLMKWSQDIASGMSYIASKNLVHRDLAARNVLLTYDGYNCHCPHGPHMLTAKISDFGLSKNLHEYPKDYYRIVFNRDSCRRNAIELPLRWISVEALETFKFTTESDVWAFGVTLWEIFSLGAYPYGTEIPDNEYTDVLQSLRTFLRSGQTLGEPPFAPSRIWDLMQRCWSEDPKDRPTFADLHNALTGINENTVNLSNQEEPRQEQPASKPTGYSEVTILENPVFDAGAYSDEETTSQSSKD